MTTYVLALYCSDLQGLVVRRFTARDVCDAIDKGRAIAVSLPVADESIFGVFRFDDADDERAIVAGSAIPLITGTRAQLLDMMRDPRRFGHRRPVLRLVIGEAVK